jgi:hypothetical protein
MNLHPCKLFFLLAALLLLVACGGVSESDIEATVEARVEQAKASLIAPTAAPILSAPTTVSGLVVECAYTGNPCLAHIFKSESHL